jgi:TonB family protein
MKKTIFITALLALCFAAGAQSKPEDLAEIDKPAAPQTKAEVIDSANRIYTAIDKMPAPSFDIQKYLANTIRYPADARTYEIQGRVIAKFVVDKDGSIVNAMITSGIGGGCDEETLRVINAMPKWTPGYHNGQPVRVYYTLPVSYRLEGLELVKPIITIPEGEEIYNAVDEMPQPPFDIAKYLKSCTFYPLQARKEGISGKVLVKFVVDKKGRVANVTMASDIGGGCGDEAVRVVRHMPAWTPGRIKGKRVNVNYMIPVTFRLAK